MARSTTATVTRLHTTPDGREAWDQEVEVYLSGAELRGLSGHTIRSYRDSLDRWAAFLEADRRNVHPDAARHQDAVAYMTHLQGAQVLRRPTPGRTGATAATRLQRYMAVRKFFAWYLDQPGVELRANPFARVDRPRLQEEPVPTVPVEAWGQLLDTTRGRTFGDLRDRAVLLLLADTGARRGELAAIRLGLDLDMATRRVILRGKTGTRTVTFGAATHVALAGWLRVRKDHPQAAWEGLVGDPGSRREVGRPLFLATPGSGAGAVAPAFLGSGIASMVRRRCAQAGLASIHPHQLRHTWAVARKATGATDGDLMHDGGWSSMAMVVRYGKADAERVALQNYRSPVDMVLGTGGRSRKG